jgi:hypothetical protein
MIESDYRKIANDVLTAYSLNNRAAFNAIQNAGVIRDIRDIEEKYKELYNLYELPEAVAKQYKLMQHSGDRLSIRDYRLALAVYQGSCNMTSQNATEFFS